MTTLHIFPLTILKVAFSHEQNEYKMAICSYVPLCLNEAYYQRNETLSIITDMRHWVSADIITRQPRAPHNDPNDETLN